MASGARFVQALRKSHAMGPSVRNLINQYKLDPNQISSTGPHQTLLKGDVLSYLNNHRPGNDTSQADDTTASTLFASKPATHRSGLSQVGSHSNKRYARRMLTDLEIEVINAGGLMELADTKQDGRMPKKR